MKTCIFSPLTCFLFVMFSSKSSLLSHHGLETPHELPRMLALNRFLGKGLKMSVSCQGVRGSEGRAEAGKSIREQAPATQLALVSKTTLAKGSKAKGPILDKDQTVC